jgi:hypothetical protein
MPCSASPASVPPFSIFASSPVADLHPRRFGRSNLGFYELDLSSSATLPHQHTSSLLSPTSLLLNTASNIYVSPPRASTWSSLVGMWTPRSFPSSIFATVVAVVGLFVVFLLLFICCIFVVFSYVFVDFGGQLSLYFFVV